MIGDEHSLYRLILQIFGKLTVVVKEAGRFDDHGLAVLFQNKDFVVNIIVGLIRVQLYRSKIVNVHFALVKLYGLIRIFVHSGFLPIFPWFRSMGTAVLLRP